MKLLVKKLYKVKMLIKLKNTGGIKMKKMIKMLLLINIILLFASCGIEYEDIEMRIGPNKITIDENPYFDMAYYVKFDPEAEEWEELKGDIKNFDFEWGYQYKVKVRRQERKPCAEEIDGYDYEYKMLEILTRSQVDLEETFELKLKKGAYNYIDYEEDASDVDEGYYLPDNTQIIFDNDDLVTQLTEIYNTKDIGNKLVTGVFEYNFEDDSTVDQEIILIEIKEEELNVN